VFVKEGGGVGVGGGGGKKRLKNMLVQSILEAGRDTVHI
jgi:hypothetical protein